MVTPHMNRVVGRHFRVRRRIGGGSFGEIYSGEDTRNHRRVAIKLEPLRTRVPQLLYESRLYAIFSGGTGIPKLHWFGADDSHNVLVIDLLGKSLEDLFASCQRHFSLKTVLMLADQMICCLEFIHVKSFMHRDIKPDNFVMGLGDASNQVFIIDFGLSKKYRDPHTHIHIPCVEGKSLTGTARYASLAAMRGLEQSRRDDLESLGFVWMYLLLGRLPWMGLAARDQKQKYARICDVKSRVSFEELCRGFPAEFVRYFHAVRGLHFSEQPNYAEFRRMFRELFMREGDLYD
jgi:casein kinase 1